MPIEISLTVGFRGNYSGDGPPVSSSNADINNWNTAMAKNGLEIRRSRINTPFKVIRINQDKLLQILGDNVGINVGDIVESINLLSLEAMQNEEVCRLLCETDVDSITYYTPIQWAQKLRRIQNNNVNNSTIRRQNNFTNLHSSSQSSNSLELRWDYENKCEHCGFIYLHTEIRKTSCCLISRNMEFPHLNPLPDILKNIAISYLHLFSRDSVLYNNILALGATGVENGKSGGWEWTPGDHSVKLHGRYLNTYLIQ